MTVTEAKVGASGGLIGVVAVGEGVDVRVWFVRGGGNGGNLMTSPTIAASAMGVLRAVVGPEGAKPEGRHCENDDGRGYTIAQSDDRSRDSRATH
jgi:hypothetical protein